MRVGLEARRLVRVVEGIADRDVAVGFLRHELARLGPDESAAVIAEIDARAEMRDDASARVMLLVSVALAARECDELRVAIAEAAIARGDVDTARRLRPEPGARAADDDAATVPDFGRGRPMTLGERKSLARGRDRDLLARVLRDPHPDVIRIVLANPAITEPDVVRLCAKRPIVPEVLREVARSSRWMVRYGVRLALARNPYTPLDVALSVVPHLNAQDARDIAGSPELHDQLREACARAARPRTIH
ncbi:hypothetical protein [Sandaracinus amylolyticus]|uniref:hypothetical protein n=1 Tax=Sandaracinus amylolyticus TaxID=927083 RepID=UPI001F202FEB|nr:hypothetical protein [Sandaracinus amylolyticus]UJR81117.1 Hypothetical protein I5071_31690 [Sandaracinus amylolyticus]